VKKEEYITTISIFVPKSNVPSVEVLIITNGDSTLGRIRKYKEQDVRIVDISSFWNRIRR